MGLKVDINAIFRDNMKKTNATRKNNWLNLRNQKV